MGLIAAAKGEFVKALLEKLTHGDTGSSLLGLIAAAVLASGISLSDLFSSDETKKMHAWGLIAAASLIAIWGWVTGAPPGTWRYRLTHRKQQSRGAAAGMILILVFASAATVHAEAPPAQPGYVLAAGVSIDALSHQSSTVTTFAVRLTDIAGLPLYQQSTIETGLIIQPGVANTATLRVGAAQTVYQSANGQISFGVCGDGGFSKAGDVATLGTISGCGWFAWDLGAKITGGKAHVYLIPTYRIIAVAGVQVKPSYAIRIGTGF